MRTFPIPTNPSRESSDPIARINARLHAADGIMDVIEDQLKGPRPYHVAHAAPPRQFACSHNCGHPACTQGCTLQARRRAFLEGQ